MVENQTPTFKAGSAEEASQLVREGWVLQSIQKRREIIGKDQLIYFLVCPQAHKPVKTIGNESGIAYANALDVQHGVGVPRKKIGGSLLSLLNNLMSAAKK